MTFRSHLPLIVGFKFNDYTRKKPSVSLSSQSNRFNLPTVGGAAMSPQMLIEFIWRDVDRTSEYGKEQELWKLKKKNNDA